MKGVKPEDVISLFRNNKGADIAKWTDKNYIVLQRIIYSSIHKGMGFTCGVFTKHNELCSAAFIIKNNNGKFVAKCTCRGNFWITPHKYWICCLGSRKKKSSQRFFLAINYSCLFLVLQKTSAIQLHTCLSYLHNGTISKTNTRCITFNSSFPLFLANQQIRYYLFC